MFLGLYIPQLSYMCIDTIPVPVLFCRFQTHPIHHSPTPQYQFTHQSFGKLSETYLSAQFDNYIIRRHHCFVGQALATAN